MIKSEFCYVTYSFNIKTKWAKKSCSRFKFFFSFSFFWLFVIISNCLQQELRLNTQFSLTQLSEKNKHKLYKLICTQNSLLSEINAITPYTYELSYYWVVYFYLNVTFGQVNVGMNDQCSFILYLSWLK